MKTSKENDLKKDDGTGVIAATNRSCYMNLQNRCGSTIHTVALTHTSGEENNVIKLSKLDNGGDSTSKQITYETGPGADRDYWNISFTIDGIVYRTPYNDRCNIASDDEGQTIHCIVGPGSNGNYTLIVQMPQSSSCEFVIKRV